MIIIRTLRKDIAKYNKIDEEVVVDVVVVVLFSTCLLMFSLAFFNYFSVGVITNSLMLFLLL